MDAYAQCMQLCAASRCVPHEGAVCIIIIIIIIIIIAIVILTITRSAASHTKVRYVCMYVCMYVLLLLF